ncbi:hypothetical protein QUF74_09915 [Candidatus Halobeggiatoa sp. HSG11]|nr:hypothetical protein [Candidatus Halobeggiatoa sp. HSG11]
MSYILEAIRKDEREREANQFIDCSDDKRIFSKKILILIIVFFNMIVWSVLLWSKEPLKSPQITIISPLSSPQSHQRP